MITVFWIVVGVAAVVALFMFAKTIMSPELKYHSLAYKIKAKITFWVGDIRRLDSFPYLTWAGHEHKLSYREMREASDICRAGDIGLHRDAGYASNLAIPGGFKHGWICVENGDIVEAVSEGVLKRGNLAPLISDYVVILRPMGINKQEINEAVRRAEGIVGCEYDANFNFDFGGQARVMPDTQEKSFVQNLDSGNFHMAFSCTEVVGYSWYHCKDKLRIFRSKYAGRDAIIADDYLRMNFGIVWMSASVTPEWAKECGMPEEAVQKIKDFRDGKRDFNAHGNPVPRRL